MTAVVGAELAEAVGRLGPFDAAACMNCGVCTAVCPMGIAWLPRRLQRAVVLGLEQEVVAATEPVYACLLCRLCEVSCPAGVHITENVRTLRRYLNRRVFGL